MRKVSSLYFVGLLLICAQCGQSKDNDVNEKNEASEKWKKKDIRDYSEADLERLYDQWEEADEDELEEDELPEWKKPKPKIDLSNVDMGDPESLMKASKKGQTLMMFVSVTGTPTERESEEITKLWQSSLFNANYEIQRYMVGNDRAIFMVKDGSKAWEIKDYLVKQDRCKDVTIEGQVFPGLAAGSQDSGSAPGGVDNKPKPQDARAKKSQKDSKDQDKNKTKKKSNSKEATATHEKLRTNDSNKKKRNEIDDEL
ncbi:unnamed protein product [Owenia fusiformis]|uniref:Uncharacterized protein n=1 Tax=Owenia fusiformis TaxID=6347 RepID=A0A8J1XRE4_OWEFU|nr:unnamed protein product [Owenia fusiformis]